MAKFNARQRGFTLIEMSIVLVIIGLIIGGILKGQELIETARQKNLVSQIDAVRSGVNTFLDRYKMMPGDYTQSATNISADALVGNGDGWVGTVRADTAGLQDLTDNVMAKENMQFFQHLVAANLIGGGQLTKSTVTVACFAGNCATNSPQPSSAFPQSGLSVQYGTHTGLTADTLSPLLSHWIVVSRWKAGALAGGVTDGALSPQRAFQIDNKYDDGVSSTGNIRSSGIGTGCGDAANSYTPTVNAANCHIDFALSF